MHAQNSTNHIAVFGSRDRNWPIRALEFRILPDYRNFRFLTASWITWPTYGHLIGRNCRVLSKQRISFVFKPKSERSTKIMHAQNSTNHIAVFRSRDRNWPIRVLEFRILPDYRNFRFLTASWITWAKYGNLIGRIFPVFLKKKFFLSISLSLFFSFPILFALHVWPSMFVFISVLYFYSPSLCFMFAFSTMRAFHSCMLDLLVMFDHSFCPPFFLFVNHPFSHYQLCNCAISRRGSLLMSCANWTTLTIPRLKRVSAHAQYTTTSTNLIILLTFHVILAWIWTSDLSIWCLVHYQVNQPDNHDDRWKSCWFCVLTIYIYI